MTFEGDTHPLAEEPDESHSRFFAPEDPPEQPAAAAGTRPAIDENDAGSESWTS
jgi:hypothetical protein